MLLPIAIRRRLSPRFATASFRWWSSALVQVAAPFLLITFGERHISSSLTGILVAAAPIFTFLLAFAIDQEERAERDRPGRRGDRDRRRRPPPRARHRRTAAALVGGLMVVLASLGYALGAYYLKRRFKDVQPVGLVAAPWWPAR